MPRINSSSELEKFRNGILSDRDPKKPCITLCSGSACHATGSRKVAESIEEEVNNMVDGVTEFTDCNNLKLPVNSANDAIRSTADRRCIMASTSTATPNHRSWQLHPVS